MHRRCDVGRQRGLVEGLWMHAHPALPGGAASVHGLPVVQVVGAHGGWSRAPRLVGGNGLLVTVSEPDGQFGEGAELAAVKGTPSVPAQPSAVPAVAERNGQHDGAAGRITQESRDVIGAVSQSPLVTAPAGAEHIVGYWLAIDGDREDG